ncbi:hypothetical protein MSG28_000163 [Choristoneura fumiferana]|uniref:Uncharacterized protein n=1 Tax=Choristoneura fumiferana TaxID=7141 RepID=A0ACC0K009_CHOFU|nr:hypothetical protein MSG28_000163 [Choristoneura fumiferana]
MVRALVVLCCLGLAVASPPIVRSREEIQAFRSFLENTQTENGDYIARMTSPLANPEENSGKYQGDIVLDDFIIDGMLQEYAQGRNAYTWPNTKWPNDTVGLANGCYANVGYWASRGVHTLNLARNTPGVGCFRHATIVHEWMHILGFLHMQSTYDRDEYVRIVEENLQAGTEHNFDIYTSDLVSNLGVEYDYVSCLHYGPFAFSNNGQATIVALQEHEGVMGQRVYITDKDWLRINRHYNCPGAWD